MNKKGILAAKHKHPEGLTLAQMQAESDAALATAQKGGGQSKTAVLVKAADEGPALAPPKQPTPEQLERINQFTLSPKTAEQLYVFETLSMNDLPDRDDDLFTTETVEGFAALPQPYSPIGKSYMVDHDYKVGNARGRIFGARAEKVATESGEATFLINEVYVPATAQYADFIEGLDFGINWAVSVGVTLGATECTVCAEPFSSWGYWCRNGHDKGLYYDPDSDETDNWGYPAPCAPEDPKAVKCLRKFLDPKDFYELSQVFLGAQYFAALSKQVGGDLAVAAKGAGGFVSLSVEGVKGAEIEFKHAEPERVRDARKNFEVTIAPETGDLVWTDDDGLGWTFDPFDPEQKVLCTGRKDATDDPDGDEDDDSEEVNNDGSAEAGSEPVDSDGEGVEDPAGSDEGAGSGGDAPEGGSEGAGGEVPVGDDTTATADPGDSGDEGDPSDSDSDEGGDSDEEEEDDETDDASDDDDAEKAVKRAPTSKTFLSLLPESLRAGIDKGASYEALQRHIEGLTIKADLGEKYIKALKADAVAWYAKANFRGDAKGVRTEAFQKMLDRLGDDADLILEVTEEQKELAKERLPQKVRRASAPKTDPNTPDVAEKIGQYDSSEVEGDDSAERIVRRHVD